MKKSYLPVEEYMRLPYRILVYEDQDYWAAEFPELPGLVAGADTWEELQATLADAKRSYFEAAIEAGKSIPMPTEHQEEFSGRVLLRLPRSVHRRAARAAEREAVSLNTWLVSAVSEVLGRRESRPLADIPLTIEFTANTTPHLASTRISKMYERRFEFDLGVVGGAAPESIPLLMRRSRTHAGAS